MSSVATLAKPQRIKAAQHRRLRSTSSVRFPGQYFDSETGLYHNGARDYDPSLGRYIESDPIGLAGGVNTFAYVGNNPVSNIDPLGLCGKCSKYQQIAAYVGQVASTVSDTTGDAATAGAGLTLLSLASTGPEDPVTLGLTIATDKLGQVSLVTGLDGVALNTYASGGNPGYAESFATSWLASRIFGVSDALSEVSFGKSLSDVLNDVAGKVAASVTAPPPPCQGGN